MVTATGGKLLLRAVANALWMPLRRAVGDDHWPVVTDWRVNDPTGQGRAGSGYAPSAGFQSAVPRLEPINDVGRVMGRLEPEEWPGDGDGQVLVARLAEDDYQSIYAQLTMTEMQEWVVACLLSSARRPFVVGVTRHGRPRLCRNVDPRALVTLAVADFLVALASLADVRLLTPDEDKALTTEALQDSDDRMRPNEVFAIADRSGIEPPRD